jgi:hypothetical protein
LKLGKGKRLPDVLPRKVGEISQQFPGYAASGNRRYDHAHRHPHPADAQLTAHYVRIDRNAAWMILHVRKIAHTRLWGGQYLERTTHLEQLLVA